MRSFRVLAVDDEAEWRQQIEEALQRKWNKDASFEVVSYASFEDAQGEVARGSFDFIVLDLKDGEEEQGVELVDGDTEGEKIFQALRKTKFVPVIFFTGYSHKVEEKQSPVVRVISKTEGVAGLRVGINAVLDTGIPQLRQHIEDVMRAYMWEALDANLVGSLDQAQPTELAILFGRRVARGLERTAIADFLGLTGDHVRPLEYYLFPPDQGLCRPGDVLEDSQGGRWSVLTPACDFAQKKASKALLARVTPLKLVDEYKNWKKADDEHKAQLKKGDAEAIGTSEKKLNNSRSSLVSLIKNTKAERFYSLPGTFFLAPSVVDFQDLVSLDLKELSRFKLLCSLDSPFSEELLSRFSRYFGRLGTPDMHLKELWESIQGI